MDSFIEIFAVGVGILTATGIGTAVTGWIVVRKVKRSRIVQRAAGNSILAAKAFAPDRAVREPAKLIGELRRSSRATRGALEEATRQGWPVGHLPRAAQDLERAMQSLENQLRFADREPNRALRAEWTADLGQQTRTLEGLSADLRRCLLQTSRSVDQLQLEQASSRLTAEISAMQSWQSSYGSRQAW
ncbi:hypothetical protein [Arthrobacter sp. Br18]|uniref:hypothetical protein n=1 Tax=Arthrobacter sp. Br18 TaxID=1312954 RepID=UPI000479ED29|nr:hypothetical protein [Arthrobacter sp. Br18]